MRACSATETQIRHKVQVDLQNKRRTAQQEDLESRRNSYFLYLKRLANRRTRLYGDMEKYTLVVNLTSVRVFLAIVAALDLSLHQTEAIYFLSVDLEGLFFVEQPLGFKIRDPALTVCLLEKSLCRLKQVMK